MADYRVNVLGVDGEELAPTYRHRAMGLLKGGKARLVTIQLVRGLDEKDGNINEGATFRPATDPAKGRRSQGGKG